jgi:hypothetical protein
MGTWSKSAKEIALEKKVARTGSDRDAQQLVNQQIKNHTKRGR